MVDHFFWGTYRILCFIGGVGVFAGLLSELYNHWHDRRNARVKAEARKAYLQELENAYKESYHEIVPSFYIRLRNVQERKNPRKVPLC